MHLSLKTSQALEEGDGPINPEQSPADVLVLSFTDSDLACMAAACSPAELSLRLTSLASLKHPLSVDLYIEQVASHAKVILVRMLGGYEWWRYGADELARLAGEKNIRLLMVSGDGVPDDRLTKLSTATPEAVKAVDICLRQGGVENARQVLHSLIQPDIIPTPIVIAHGGLYKTEGAYREGSATVIFYRAHYLAADTAPIDTLLDALTRRGLAARAFMITSLRDGEALSALREDIASHPPDILIDATAFSAGDGNIHPLADSNVPILACALANTRREAWRASPRGLGASDMAMHIVLPEANGRIFTRAISFKAEAEAHASLEFTQLTHQPEPDRVDYVADLAMAWIRLAKKKPKDKRLALLLSDYPGRSGRNAYAVGLDAPQSALHILKLLADEGYAVHDIPDTGTALMGQLRQEEIMYSLTAYEQRFAMLPPNNQRVLIDAWGKPEEDACFSNEAFHLKLLRLGNIVVALQPDRGSRLDRKSGYHDPAMPPRHGYLAFYWWLRDVAAVDAIVHLGTHGNLEWLPGKAVALSSACWPEIALAATPVIYPYIVSDPGEAAQAKRRISAVCLSHLTPPLKSVALSPELAEIEALVDEYSSADGLDSRRMKLLRQEILHCAKRAGLAGVDDNALLSSLEAHLCDIKEQRVSHGLHVFGRNAESEVCYLRAALQGRFIPPGPGGSPARGRMDVLPTGRNLIAMDPRMIPTRTASAIGKQAAEEFVRRYVQDHGDWPKNVVIDVWGSATLRNGGDEVAQALYLMGARPSWDESTARVTGFDIIPEAKLSWPRIDVSLRISGLFRDMFVHLITLFDDAAQALFASSGQRLWRIFGAAPGAYGTGVTELIDQGAWTRREELGQAYMEASQFVYGRHAQGQAEPQALKERLARADALVHVQDQRETDVLSGADFADAEGGFAAAAKSMGAAPALYHLDTSRPDAIKARTLAEEISLVLQSRILNCEWIEGQMQHGYAGAAAFANGVDQLFAFAATSDAVHSPQFDAVFEAYLHNEDVRSFIAAHNPEALKAMAMRFDEALQRGFWRPLRNSAAASLQEWLGQKARDAA